MIEHDEICAEFGDEPADLLRLTAADIQPRVRRAPRASYDAQHIRPSRARERFELAQLVFAGRTSQPNAHQESTFATAGTLKQRRSFCGDGRLRAFFLA